MDLQDRISLLETLLSESEMEHYTEPEGLVSCPALVGGECDCGADDWNSKIASVLAGGMTKTYREIKLEELLRKASTCIYNHHESSYKPELGSICPVCCPDGNPYKGVLAEIGEALR